jgi:hypothetical protein
MATVFARLKVPAPPPSRGGASPAAAGSLVDHGVHAFVVPIRNGGRGAEACLPGVQILDCGYKVGLQGVDNGALRFTNVRIPRDHLLDRFATVDAAGTYASSLSPGKRFAATLGELTGGRVGLTGSSCAVLKAATAATLNACSCAESNAARSAVSKPTTCVADKALTCAVVSLGTCVPLNADTWAVVSDFTCVAVNLSTCAVVNA